MPQAGEEEPWQALVAKLVARPDFWQDALTLKAYAATGAASLAWDALSNKVILLRMLLPEVAQIIAVGQAGIVGLLTWSSPRVRQTLLGKALLLLNVIGIGLHLKRIRVSLQSGPAFQRALQDAGIKDMQSPLVPMLLALMFPLRNFLGEKGQNLQRTSAAYASIEEIDPELVAWHERLPETAKKVNLRVGRGLIPKWMSLDVVARTNLDSKRPVPALLYIHGGAWVLGDRKFSARAFVEHLATHHDVVVFVINYRLAPEARYPSQLHDCKRALAWIKSNGHEYGADPSRCFVAGESAGGHLTSLMAITANNPDYNPPEFTGDEDTSVVGAIDIYGVHDILDSERHHARNSAQQNNRKLREDVTPTLVRLWERVVFGKPLSDHGDAFEDASPAHILVSKRDELVSVCPFLVIHGTNDVLAAFDDSRAFFSRLQEVRKATKSAVKDIFVELEGADHGFGYVPSPRTVSMSLAVAAFMDHHIELAHAGSSRL
ncbi:Carboxylesterase 1 [Hondaea fermentalgiana]|uniref:Carboxylesterase 1 n=1 Tax=Hondaea fermentalgiana TaxID=2315210 RepID=A0A2R5GWH6_9STRA|nr:Carboxylesterase 1 [Hondaea fermentalgiana]|eukprot:GBG34118.1 Carboxylesterase 1 [Hondaea fermentalgiana]